MTAPQSLPIRLIGALFVERGLVSESQIRVALEIQRETGQQLGQVLVERFGVSRKELASVVAEQWAKLGGSSGPEDSASWRRLGEIFVDRGFVSQDELDHALTRQRQTGERLGEALVAQGVISKFELAGALAEQMAELGESTPEMQTAAAQAPATVHQLPTRDEAPDEAPTPDNVVELAPARDPVVVAEPDTSESSVDADAENVEVPGVVPEPESETVDMPLEATNEGVATVEEPQEGAIEAFVETEPDVVEAAVDERLPVEVPATGLRETISTNGSQTEAYDTLPEPELEPEPEPDLEPRARGPRPSPCPRRPASPSPRRRMGIESLPSTPSRRRARRSTSRMSVSSSSSASAPVRSLATTGYMPSSRSRSRLRSSSPSTSDRPEAEAAAAPTLRARAVSSAGRAGDF